MYIEPRNEDRYISVTVSQANIKLTLGTPSRHDCLSSLRPRILVCMGLCHPIFSLIHDLTKTSWGRAVPSSGEAGTSYALFLMEN